MEVALANIYIYIYIWHSLIGVLVLSWEVLWALSGASWVVLCEFSGGSQGGLGAPLCAAVVPSDLEA